MILLNLMNKELGWLIVWLKLWQSDRFS